MKAFEFSTNLNSPNSLEIPSHVAAQLHRDQEVRVVLLIGEAPEDAEWATLTSAQFFDGYSSSDAIYDELPGR